ncbi:hypothetical protein ACWC5I_28830 [Kitasatospora sp. NPDC001574]
MGHRLVDEKQGVRMSSERDRRRMLRDAHKAEHKRAEWDLLGLDRE